MSDSRDRRRRLCLIGLGCIIVAFLIAVGTLIPLREWDRLTRLRDDGARVPAQITKSETDLTRKFAADVIHFEFQAENEMRPRTGVVRLSLGRGDDPLGAMKMYNEEREQALMVRYLKDDPSIFCLERTLPERISQARMESLGYLGLAGAVGLIGLGLAAWGLPAWRVHRLRKRTSPRHGPRA